MLRLSLLSILLAASATWAQYPLGKDIKQLGLTFQFDHFIALLRNDPLAAALIDGPSQVTIVVPFNIPIGTFGPRLRAAPPTQANQAAIRDVSDRQRLSNLLRYLILNGSYPSASLPKGWSFPPSSLFDRAQYPLSEPAKVGVFSDQTNFFVRTGDNFTSNVVIKVCFSGGSKLRTLQFGPLQVLTLMQDIPFSNGLIHAVDFPLAPPANISSTGLSVGNRFLHALALAVPSVDTLVDITIFAPCAGYRGRKVRWDDYIVVGKIAYTTLLTDGTVLKARSGKNLTVKVKDGGKIFVNGVRIIAGNTLTANGVIHLLER